MSKEHRLHTPVTDCIGLSGGGGKEGERDEKLRNFADSQFIKMTTWPFAEVRGGCDESEAKGGGSRGKEGAEVERD